MTISQLLFRVKYTIAYVLRAKSNLYIHSPLAYDICNHVLSKKADSSFYQFNNAVEKLCNSHTKLQAISISKRYRLLLYHLIRFSKAKQILELGTGYGISSAYMAFGGASVTSVDKDPERILYAKHLHSQLKLGIIEYVQADIAEHLKCDTKKYELVFIDANHTKSALLEYYKMLVNRMKENSIIVVDDINWSADMYDAWNEIKISGNVKMSIELYRMGLLFFDKRLKTKYHFVLKL